MEQSIKVSFNYKIKVPSEWRNEWPCSKLAGKEINVTVNNLGEVEDWFFADGPFYPSIGVDVEGAELDAVLGKFSPEDVKRQVNLTTKDAVSVVLNLKNVLIVENKESE